MNDTEVVLQIKYRTNLGESIEEHYGMFYESLEKLPSPFGTLGLRAPKIPSISPESDTTIGVEWIKYPSKGLEMQLTAQFRHELCVGADKASSDDYINAKFKSTSKQLNYREILESGFPKLIEAYRGYRARAARISYAIKYTDCFWNEWEGRETTNPTYWKLRENSSVDIDGRNNIYTLEPAVFWDGELCRRALGFDRDEAIRRLTGHAILVRPLMDGVYAVLNDDPQLSYEDYVAMNQRFKGLLGLI